MTIFLLALAATAYGACAVLFLLWRAASRGKKTAQEKLDACKKQLGEAIAQQAKLESTIDILKANRKEADEKIDDLHSGNAVSNALDELHKRKN